MPPILPPPPRTITLDEIHKWLRQVFNLLTLKASTIKGSDGNYYTCIKDHVSGSSSKPVTGASWASYWKLLGTAGTDWIPGVNYYSGAFDWVKVSKDGAAIGDLAGTTDNLPEGTTNKYLSGKTTDNLPEGTTNKYFTDERVDDRVAALLLAGNAVTLTYNDVDNTLTVAVNKASASTDASASAVSVTSANATDLASVITLANELKADVNQLVADVNAMKDSLNDLKAKLRTAGFLNT